MKKVFYILIISLFSLTITGCGSKKEDSIMNCSLTIENSTAGYTLNTKYKVTYSGDIIKKSELVETVKSDNSSVLTYFKSYLDTYYKELNNSYGGYTWEITSSDSKVISNTVIDYTKLDMAKYAKDYPGMKEYINDKNELTITGLKTMYSENNVICD